EHEDDTASTAAFNWRRGSEAERGVDPGGAGGTAHTVGGVDGTRSDDDAVLRAGAAGAGGDGAGAAAAAQGEKAPSRGCASGGGTGEGAPRARDGAAAGAGACRAADD